ncbi:HAD hydrolase-like protein [Homoserinibacter sp. YIM 151385]|uniref:HAD hydrolase-like protein n=1 Tax=Homoserinibacter sp. YIM 151385 TaxID=2985506 RepID=UPI0022F11C80|nr:HAD hydrolase-like protein [Homoserinibacter sp. YIM 151385]WBU37195.1 HAD hydrolase-like protein [Homoserinibacter sp. YIM 151385]
MSSPRPDLPAAPWTAILLDLDGTIVDSAPGITASLAHMYEQLGRPVPAPAELLTWVGPPILDSMRDLAGFDAEESALALAFYREHYFEIGALDATPFPGVPEVVREIAAAGIPLSLATSKPEHPARLILDRLELTSCFTAVTGASEDEVRSAKADVVAEALRRLGAGGADLARVVHVGDRSHDVEGAAANGVPTIFATWGYGSPPEQAGAITAVDTAEELRAALGLTALDRAS